MFDKLLSCDVGYTDVKFTHICFSFSRTIRRTNQVTPITKNGNKIHSHTLSQNVFTFRHIKATYVHVTVHATLIQCNLSHIWYPATIAPCARLSTPYQNCDFQSGSRSPPSGLDDSFHGSPEIKTVYHTYILITKGCIKCQTYNRKTPHLGTTQPHIQWVTGTLSLGLKRPGAEADHWPATNN